jgi:hypothetical protein
MACPARANATPVCAAGACAQVCAAGFGDCDGDATNGCESNLQTSATSCGRCGNACAAGGMCRAGACVSPSVCASNPNWTPVTCTTGSWVWSMDRAVATTAAAANTARVLASGCRHGAGQPELGSGMCSLTGTGFVSTRTFTMSGCDARWFHLGGSFTGNCGGHDGDTYRLLALGPNDCYDY